MWISGREPAAQGARGARRLRALATLSLSIVVASCSTSTPSTVPPSVTAPGGSSPPASPSTSPGPGAVQSPGPAATFDSTVPPVDLTVTTQANNTARAIVPVTGGELKVTGADGTVYTLTIPDDALLVDTEITMTPVASIAGLPTSGEVTYAVQLGPDGLHLADFATLTIAPTQDLPIDQQIAFGYEGAGKAMFLAFPVVKDPGIRLQILHFSGYGVTKGQLASLEAVRARFGGDADARLNSDIAAFLAKEHALEMSGHPMASDFWDAFEDLLNAYEREVVEPRVAAAGKSCANGRLAWESAKNLEHQRQVLPFPTPSLDLGELATTIAHVCTQEEYEICRDDHIVHRMLQVILGYERQRQLDGRSDAAEWEFERATAKKCLTFEVRFVSTATGTLDPVDVVSKMKATVTISLDTEASPMVIKGESPLINTDLQLRLTVKGDCAVKSLRGGSVFKVLDVKFDATPSRMATKDEPGDPGTLKDIALTYLPTESTDNGTIKCPNTPIRLLPGPFWSGLYLGTHATERGTPDGAYTIKEWRVTPRAVKVGTKDWDYSFPAVRWTDEGSFELYHRPQ